MIRRSLEAAPLVIAACNEKDLIARTLGRLPAKGITPIVAVNGSTDRTANIARNLGAEVVEIEEMGKLPAQQAVVRNLRDNGHQPQNPILFMDADSYPAFPNSWAKLMGNRRASKPEVPEFVSGLTGFVDGNNVVNALRTTRRYQRATGAALRHPGSLDTVYGANMAVSFGTEEVREEFLDLPHIWPGEDKATAKLVMGNEGAFRQSIDPRSLVLASARNSVPFIERLLYGKQHVATHHEDDYTAHRAPSATHRFDPNTGNVVLHS